MGLCRMSRRGNILQKNVVDYLHAEQLARGAEEKSLRLRPLHIARRVLAGKSRETARTYTVAMYVIPAALLVALAITLLIALMSKRPLRMLVIFFAIIFLATLSGQLWIRPFGPVTWGISWVPLFVVSLFFAFLVLALIPPVSPPKPGITDTADESAAFAMGLFFWLIILLLLLAISVGYYRQDTIV